MHAHLDLLRIARIERVLIEGGEGADHAPDDRHRMGVAWEAVVEAPHVLMDHRVERQRRAEGVEFGGGGQLAVDQEIGHLHIVGLRGEVFDRVAAVAKDPLFTIEVGDGAGGGAGVDVALVEGDRAGGGPEPRDVEGPLPLGADDERNLGRVAVDLEAGDAIRLGTGPGRGGNGFGGRGTHGVLLLKVAKTRPIAARHAAV